MYALVAQLVEQYICNVKVVGSIPIQGSIILIAQPGSEQLFYKEKVVGSNPTRNTISSLVQGTERHSSKVDVAGSNPA